MSGRVDGCALGCSATCTGSLRLKQLLFHDRGRAASRTQPRLQRLRPWQQIAGALSLGWHVVAVLPGIAKLGEPPERELS